MFLFLLPKRVRTVLVSIQIALDINLHLLKQKKIVQSSFAIMDRIKRPSGTLKGEQWYDKSGENHTGN